MSFPKPNLFLSLLSLCVVASFGDVCLADTIQGQASFNETQIVDGDDGVFSTVSIAESGIIQDVSVTIENINHTSVGDLVAELRFLGNGGPSGPGGNPAYLFFRPNVDDSGLLGSRSNLDGSYTFTTNGNDSSFWTESSIPDDEVVNNQIDYFASDADGNFHDLAGPDFFEGFDAQGDWQLVIRDENAFGLNEGSVEGWSIEFHVNAIPEPSTAVFLMCAASTALLKRRR